VKKLITVRRALEDPAWLGSMMGGESFAVMRILLIASMGEPLSSSEMEIFTQLTGRTETPGEAVNELKCFAAQHRRGCPLKRHPGSRTVDNQLDLCRRRRPATAEFLHLSALPIGRTA
jgi:hypothetical protein